MQLARSIAAAARARSRVRRVVRVDALRRLPFGSRQDVSVVGVRNAACAASLRPRQPTCGCTAFGIRVAPSKITTCPLATTTARRGCACELKKSMCGRPGWRPVSAGTASRWRLHEVDGRDGLRLRRGPSHEVGHGKNVIAQPYASPSVFECVGPPRHRLCATSEGVLRHRFAVCLNRRLALAGAEGRASRRRRRDALSMSPPEVVICQESRSWTDPIVGRATRDAK